MATITGYSSSRLGDTYYRTTYYSDGTNKREEFPLDNVPAALPVGSTVTTTGDTLGDGTKIERTVSETPSSRIEETNYISASTTSIPAKVTTNTYVNNIPEYNPTPAQRAASEAVDDAEYELYDAELAKDEITAKLKAQGFTGEQILSNPEYKAANTAYQAASSKYSTAQQNEASLSTPGTSTNTVYTTANRIQAPSSTATIRQTAPASDPVTTISRTSAVDISDQYAANTRDSINQRLADRDAYETAAVEGEYDLYTSPEADPSLWYNDDLGEWDSIANKPQEWAESSSGDLEWDDSLGEWVPKGSLPANWQYGVDPVTGEAELDSFGCIIGVEYYDDTDGICRPIGGSYNSLTDEYLKKQADAVAGQRDSFGCLIGVEEYDDENGICVAINDAASVYSIPGTPTTKPTPALSIRDKRAEARRYFDSTDWRFKVRLSPYSDYLYNDPNMTTGHILAPLKGTDGVIFPYTPSITVPHNAVYSSYNLTHSNYRGFFYQGSNVGDIIINGDFTAHDTAEANYLLAVIHFFKSSTKMFYGQDERRGTPPPLLYMSGMGDFQFSEHPCVLSTFNYTIPNNVDYIRAYAMPSTNDQFRGKVTTQSGAGYESWSSKITRLITSQLFAGAPPSSPNLNPEVAGVTKLSGGETYVPSKISIQLTFHPIQTRERTSKEFSLQKYAQGDLLKKGFW